MKIKSLNKDGSFVMLSGEIDKTYIAPPGIKIIISKGSTFEGVVIATDSTFHNFNKYVAKQFTLSPIGKIELTPIAFEQDSRSLTPIPRAVWNSDNSSESDDSQIADSNSSIQPDNDASIYSPHTTSLPITSTVQPALEENQHNAVALSGENTNGTPCCECMIS